MPKEIRITSEGKSEDVEKVEVNTKIKFRFKFSKKHAIILVSLILIALIPSFYFYNQYQTTKNLLQNPKNATAAETRSLIDSVGKLIELPTSEQPRLATVTDVTQLAGQPFFAHAKNGDKVLIYAQAGKAILYRESINKIIEVSPVSATSVGSQPQQSSITASGTPAPTQAPQAQTATVTVLNGTQTAGLAKSAGAKLQALSNVTVSGTGDTVGSNYQSTIIVDVSGNKSQIATQIANLLGGKVQSSLPTGEVKPTSDILVIIGSGYSK
jgi:hypothetical protein